MTHPTPAQRWQAVADRAMELDQLESITLPGHRGALAIQAALIAHHDRTAGSGGGEPVSGTRTSDPTERGATRLRSQSDRDMTALRGAVARFVDAVTTLAASSVTDGHADDWDDAVQVAHLLAEMDAIATLERTRARPARWVDQASDALDDIDKIVASHTGREPTDLESAWTSGLADEECCRVHLKLPPAGTHRKEHARVGLCWHCYDIRRMTGHEPTPELMEDWERLGSGPSWKRRLNDWMRERGEVAS